jgi:hypothetical protein
MHAHCKIFFLSCNKRLPLIEQSLLNAFFNHVNIYLSMWCVTFLLKYEFLTYDCVGALLQFIG